MDILKSFGKVLTKNVQIIEGSLLKHIYIYIVTARRYKRCPYSQCVAHDTGEGSENPS